MQEYKIILMDYDGETLLEYYSYIIPAVNDIILIEEGSFIVQARHFSITNRVVLLGEMEKPESE